MGLIRDKGEIIDLKIYSFPFSVPTTRPSIKGLHTAILALSFTPIFSNYGRFAASRTYVQPPIQLPIDMKENRFERI